MASPLLSYKSVFGDLLFLVGQVYVLYLLDYHCAGMTFIVCNLDFEFLFRGICDFAEFLLRASFWR